MLELTLFKCFGIIRRKYLEQVALAEKSPLIKRLLGISSKNWFKLKRRGLLRTIYERDARNYNKKVDLAFQSEDPFDLRGYHKIPV